MEKTMNLKKITTSFNNVRTFKINPNNKDNLKYLIVINEYYLMSVFKNDKLDLFMMYGDEQENLLQNTTISNVIEYIKMEIDTNKNNY